PLAVAARAAAGVLHLDARGAGGALEADRRSGGLGQVEIEIGVAVPRDDDVQIAGPVRARRVLVEAAVAVVVDRVAELDGVRFASDLERAGLLAEHDVA